jgi:GNAT superfamily N-acetyltransferase
LPVEIVRTQADSVAQFYRAHEREALRSFYEFPVVWHEQRCDFLACEDDATVGVATISIAASLAHVERIVVAPQGRRHGIGRSLLDAAAETASYYNCHKMCVLVPHRGSAQRFFEACGYREEAVLPQHSFKLDMAALRKFLL